MPVWLRNYTYKEIENHYLKRQENINESNNVITDTTNVDKIPKFVAKSKNNYTSKVSKK